MNQYHVIKTQESGYSIYESTKEGFPWEEELTLMHFFSDTTDTWKEKWYPQTSMNFHSYCRGSFNCMDDAINYVVLDSL